MITMSHLAILAGCIGTSLAPSCSTRKQIVAPAESGDVSIKDIKNDIPQFKREYRVKVDERCSLLVTTKSWSVGHRTTDGELDQPGGRWVLFDPGAIADKIVDPVLVPKIQRYVDQIYAIDKAFIGGNPQSFTDESGTVWERKNVH